MCGLPSSNLPAHNTCVPCSPGTYSAFSAQTECVVCDPGKVSSNGSISCTSCPAGTFAAPSPNNTRVMTCAACAPGSFSQQQGSTSCTLCEAGTYQPSSNATSCIDCPVNTHSPAPGSIKPTVCAPGSFQDSTRATSCTSCDGANQQQYVVTDPVTQLHSCRACPAGAVCANGLIHALSNMYLAEQADNTVRSFRCQPGKCVECEANTYTNGIGTVYTPYVVQSCCSDYRVIPNQTNFLCGACAPGTQLNIM